VTLTPIQIAVLAMAHEHRESGEPKALLVWGSWQRAALALGSMLVSVGRFPGSREMEWTTLHGRHRRGKQGRLVYAYDLAPGGVELAARCAQAVKRLPKGRQHATWKDVEAIILSPWGSGARQCPICGCKPGSPCAIVLRNGCGEAECVPAGVFWKLCSACEGMAKVA
jgi:hypothetical protein